MKTFEQFQNIDEKEKLFLELSHLDEIEIRFDFINYKTLLYYFYKEINLFEQDKIRLYFWINNEEIWSHFESIFNNDNEIKIFLSHMINKHFGLNDYNAKKCTIAWIYI